MKEADLESIYKVSIVLDALKEGKLQLRPEDERWVQELKGLKRPSSNIRKINLPCASVTASIVSGCNRGLPRGLACLLIPISLSILARKNNRAWPL
jgi:hypothetical protein